MSSILPDSNTHWCKVHRHYGHCRKNQRGMREGRGAAAGWAWAAVEDGGWAAEAAWAWVAEVDLGWAWAAELDWG